MEARPWSKLLLLVLLAVGLPSCYYLQSAKAPIHTIFYSHAGESAEGTKDLLILLPGIRDYPEYFQRYEFIAAVRLSGLPVDVVAVGAHYRYYARRNLLERLKEDVVMPARAMGYERLHFAGISLGGYGILLYMREHPDDVNSALLLAPYLGQPEHYAYLLEAAAAVDGATLEDEANIWPWLVALDESQRSKIFLGYGRSDSYSASHRLLSRQLPPNQVLVVEGDHSWSTWQLLWPRLLAMAPIPKALATADSPAGRSQP